MARPTRCVCRFVRKRANQAKARWRQGLKARGAWGRILATGITLPLLAYVAYAESPWFGVSFLWAGGTAVINGYIFRHQFLLLFVYLTVFFSHNVLPLLARDTWAGVLRHDWFPTLLMALIGLALWLWSRDVQTGAAFQRRRSHSGRPNWGRRSSARR